MGNPEKKHQHYVPQFVLNNWATDERVWVLNKYNGKTEEKHIRKICCKNYLYEIKGLFGGYVSNNEFENRFMKYEDEMADYIRDLINTFDLNTTDALIIRKEEREKLKKWALSIASRSPRIINYFKENKKICYVPQEFAEELYRIVKDSNPNNQVTISECQQMINNYLGLCFISPEENDDPVLGYFIKSITDFNDADFYILKNNGHNFFASDMQSLMVEDESGTIHEIVLPLSPTYSLCCSNNKCEWPNKNKINLVNDDYCYSLATILYESEYCNFIISNSKENLEKLRRRLERKNNNEC